MALFPDIENTSVSPAAIKSYMKPVQQIIGQMGGTVDQMQAGYGQSKGFALDMMDPMSNRNVQQRQMMEEQSRQQLALQNLLARR